MAKRTSLSLFEVSAKSSLVLLVHHLAALVFLLRIAIVILGLGLRSLLLVLFVRSALLGIRVRFRRGNCIDLRKILSWSVLHILGMIALSLLHLRHWCSRYRRLVRSEWHRKELLLALSGRVSKVVYRCHYRDDRNESRRCIKYKCLLRLSLRLGHLLLLNRVLGCRLSWLGIE